MWLCQRRLHQGSFVWSNASAPLFLAHACPMAVADYGGGLAAFIGRSPLRILGLTTYYLSFLKVL